VTVTPNDSGSVVDGMWTGGTAPYAVFQNCPMAGSSSLATTTTNSTIVADISALLGGAIWDIPLATPPALTFGNGTLTLTDGSCVLKYRISDYTGIGIRGAVGVACTSGPDCAVSVDACSARGTYAVPVASASGYICALCPAGQSTSLALLRFVNTNFYLRMYVHRLDCCKWLSCAGTYSPGSTDTCVPCDAGKQLSVVGADGISTGQKCTDCAAGTFGPAPGMSDCIPCSPGSYQDKTGQQTCNDCQPNSYSSLPGGTKCIKCVAGRPTVCTSTCASFSDPSEGYATAVVTTVNTLSGSACVAGGWANATTYPIPPLASTCVMNTTTVLSLYVTDTCGVIIQPLADTTVTGGSACSDPDNTASTITAYYTSSTTAATMLSDPTGTIVTLSFVSGNAVTMSMLPATTDPNSRTLSGTCSGTLSVTGGSFLTAGPSSICPAGTTSTGSGSSTSCQPCPVASYCPSASSLQSCPPGTYNGIVGAIGASSCLTCPNAT